MDLCPPNGHHWCRGTWLVDLPIEHAKEAHVCGERHTFSLMEYNEPLVKMIFSNGLVYEPSLLQKLFLVAPAFFVRGGFIKILLQNGF